MDKITEQEQDLELKLRMMRFLWSSNHFVKRNVLLIRYEFGRKTTQQYTDIDVLGITFDFDLNPHVTICDCKSGRTSTPNRIFWLSGVMKYFGANRGFFARSRVMESKYIDLANKLEIQPLSINQISELEESHKIDATHYFGSFNRDNFKREKEIFKKLRSSESQLYDYIRIGYWADPVSQQIVSLMSYASKIKEFTQVNEKEKLFLQMYVLTLLSISILKFSRTILIIPKEHREEQIKERLLGGRFESYERRKLLEGFYDFMREEIKLKYDRKYPITKKDFLSHFYPTYTKYLVDLIQRICLNPKSAVNIPQILDLITYEAVLNDKNLNREDIPNLCNNNAFYALVKPTKDVITFGERSGILSEKQTKVVRDMLSEPNE